MNNVISFKSKVGQRDDLGKLAQEFGLTSENLAKRKEAKAKLDESIENGFWKNRVINGRTETIQLCVEGWTFPNGLALLDMLTVLELGTLWQTRTDSSGNMQLYFAGEGREKFIEIFPQFGPQEKEIRMVPQTPK